MNKSIVMALLAAMLYVGTVCADQDLVSDDGRPIRLKDDGSWIFLSQDRLATTKDGRQVRLKADGSWEFTGEKSTPGRSPALDQKYIAGRSLTVTVDKLVIESRRGKKSDAHKNARKQTRSVFYLKVSVDETAKAPLSLALDVTGFAVSDSADRQYPVLSVLPASATIRPGQKLVVEVRADGSPHWWTTTGMSLSIDRNVFSSAENIVLTRAVSTAKKKKVDAF